ncbi:MAG: hypothetical protein WD894_07155 [Pirellulales bacterium]
MNDEQFWNERADKLQRFKGLCRLTPAEAQEALKKARRRRASEDEIDRIVDAVTRGELPEVDEQPGVDWSPEYDHNAMDREAALCRNEGDGANHSDETEEELLEELLDDDEPEDDSDEMED